MVIPEGSSAGAPPELRQEGVPYPDRNQALDITSIQIGLAIGFGPVFLFGVVAWVLYLFGQTLGPGFAQGLVWSQLATIGALIGLVFLWDGERAGALGLRKPSGLDVELGLGLAVVLLVIETATASYLPILYSSEAGALTSSLWLPITWPFTLVTQLPLPTALALIIAMVVSEELAVRGYAVDRLERLTQSTLLGAGGALMLDLVAHAPLWGLDYTICFIPAEMILTWLYVSERRLLPCLMGHLALDLLPLMLLALHFPLLASPPPAMNPLTMRGMELMDRREFKQAVGEFDQALQQNPKDATAYEGRGAAYTHQGYVARAIKDLDEAIRLAPTVAETYVNRSVAYRVKGDLPRALEDLTSAVNLRPSEPEYLRRRGALYSLMANHRKAIEDYSAMIALAPNNLLGYQGRFSEYEEIRDYKDALLDADAAIRVAPLDPGNYSNRALLEYDTHDYEKALADYDKAFALDPSNLQNAFSKARIYQYLGRYDDQIAVCKKLQVDHPDEPDPYACAADGYASKGDLPDAISELNGVVRLRPDHPESYRERANLELAAKRWEDVRADSKKLADLLPDDASVNNNVAWFLSAHWEAKARDGRAAIAFATRACQLTSWKQSRYVDTLAAAYAEAGDFDQAVKWEQYALKITPSETQQSVIDAMRERLELYKDRKPYRMKPT